LQIDGPGDAQQRKKKKTTNRKRGEKMGVSGTFCLFAVSFEKREGEYRSISLLKARRTAKKDLIRKSASSSTSYFPLTCAYADGYPV